MFINFDGYLCLYQYLFFDLIFIDFSWLIIVKGILLMGILISEYYVMYRFFKPIALDEKQDFSSVQLFLNLLYLMHYSCLLC